MRGMAIKIMTVLAAVLLLLLATSAAWSAGCADGKVIVRFTGGAVTLPSGHCKALLGNATYAPANLRSDLDAAGVTDIGEMGTTWHNVSSGSGLTEFSNMFVLEFPDSISVSAMIQRIEALPGVRAVQPVFQYELYWTPGDTFYVDQWHLENTGRDDALPDVDMDLEAAWDISLGSDVKVFVLDTGVEIGHEDLHNLVFNENCVYGSPTSDTNGHGTRVAGIIAADCSSATNRGVAGINCHDNAGVEAVKVTTGAGGSGPTTTQAVCGFDHAADEEARILNCSWGFCTGEPDSDFALAAAVRNAYLAGDYGGLVVCANSYRSLCRKGTFYGIPAGYPYTSFAVNTMTRDGFAWWDNKCASYVDITAPSGSFVMTTDLNDAYTTSFGATSAAAPMASGLAAYLLGTVDSLTNDDLANIITRTATTTEPWTYDNCTGWGKLNAHRAVRFISSPREFIQGVVTRANVSIDDSSSLYEKTFRHLGWCFNDSTLPDNSTTYLVKRFTMEGSPTFGSPYLDDPQNVWVRHGSGISPGWPDDDPMSCVLMVGWGAVDTTGWSSTSITLYSYTYALYETSDTSFVGYYPIHPDSIEIPYSAVLDAYDEDPYVEVIAPNGGELWGCGRYRNKEIKWEAYDDNPVAIDSVSVYWSPGLDDATSSLRIWPFELATCDSDSVWTWAVQNEDTCSNTSRIAIVAHDSTLDRNYDISDADFTGGGPQQGQAPPMTLKPRRKRAVCYAQTNATIWFNVPDMTRVSLHVYDVQGRLVKSLIRGKPFEGINKVHWNLTNSSGAKVPKGVYFYRFTAGTDLVSGKIVVVR